MGIVRMEKVITTDAHRCIGCRTCEIACSLRFTATSNPAAARLAIIRLEEKGLHIPLVCRQCADPLCAASCPMDALVRDEATGAVLLLPERCVGCRLCIQACPFGGLGVDPGTGEIIKCDLCGGDPACVAACPANALAFEPPSRLASRQRRSHARRLAKDS